MKSSALALALVAATAVVAVNAQGVRPHRQAGAATCGQGGRPQNACFALAGRPARPVAL